MLMNSWLKWSWHVKKMTLWEFTYKRRKSTSEFSWFTKLISPVCHSEALFWPHDRFFWLRDLPKLTACKGSLSQHFSLVNVGLGEGRWETNPVPLQFCRYLLIQVYYISYCSFSCSWLKGLYPRGIKRMIKLISYSRNWRIELNFQG